MANSVSSAKNSVSLLWHTNHRLRGTHWVRSPKLSEPRKTHWVRCLKPYSPKPYSACFRKIKAEHTPPQDYDSYKAQKPPKAGNAKKNTKKIQKPPSPVWAPKYTEKWPKKYKNGPKMTIFVLFRSFFVFPRFEGFCALYKPDGIATPGWQWGFQP